MRRTPHHRKIPLHKGMEAGRKKEEIIETSGKSTKRIKFGNLRERKRRYRRAQAAERDM